MAWTILSSFTLQTPRNVARRDTVMATCELKREEARSRDARVSSAASAAVSSGSISMLDTVPPRHQGTRKQISWKPAAASAPCATARLAEAKRRREAGPTVSNRSFLRQSREPSAKGQQPSPRNAPTKMHPQSHEDTKNA